MFEANWVIVKRDIEAITVPFGSAMKLTPGTQVRLTQKSGGSYTVVTDLGIMCRVEPKDADAIGEFPDAEATATGADPNAPYDDARVWEQLRTVFDPEIPVNIVDLGLVYGLTSEPLPPQHAQSPQRAEDGLVGGPDPARAGDPVPQAGHKVSIRMTMTAPGCGMGDVIKRDVEQKVASVPGVGEVQVEIVFDPPWSLDRITEAVRLQLGL